MQLNGKVAIVTGARHGIGKAITLTLAKAGAHVVATDVTHDSELRNVVSEIEALGSRSLAVATDVSKDDQVRRMVQETIDAFGRVDILVNNAGIILRRSPLLEMSQEDWDMVVDIDLKGVFLCSQAVAKHMVVQRYGKIVNLSSTAGLGAVAPNVAHYCAAKAGVIALTKCFAKELGPFDINVNAIAPGGIDTDMLKVDRTLEQWRQWKQDRINAIPIRRLGTPQDVANLALFLASDESSFITGQVITLDGGVSNKM